MNMDIPTLSELHEIRTRFQNTQISQAELDNLVSQYTPHKNQLRPGDKDELMALVDAEGNALDCIAPRWLCHLLGLRHQIVHILLDWQSPGMGRVFVLQVRHWNKDDSPGHIDISVGGHITQIGGENPVEEAAYREMEEELGITAADLVQPLKFCGGYLDYNEKPDENLYNAEWCNVFSGTLTNEGFSRIHFADQEVVGLYLCPEAEFENLLSQTRIPLAGELHRWRKIMELSKIVEVSKF